MSRLLDLPLMTPFNVSKRTPSENCPFLFGCPGSDDSSALFRVELVIRGDEVVFDSIDQRVRKLETTALAVAVLAFMESWAKNDALCCG